MTFSEEQPAFITKCYRIIFNLPTSTFLNLKHPSSTLSERNRGLSAVVVKRISMALNEHHAQTPSITDYILDANIHDKVYSVAVLKRFTGLVSTNSSTFILIILTHNVSILLLSA